MVFLPFPANLYIGRYHAADPHAGEDRKRNSDVMKREIVHDEIQCAVRGSGTILVVDDDAVLRNLTSSILKKNGYNVITAENGVECILKFSMIPSEIKGVILDLNMPVKNGYETLAELLELEPGLKILIASGDNSPEGIIKLIDAGAYGFIGKPFSPLDLSEKVKNMISMDPGDIS